jgi:hypothetical protein
VICSSPQRLGGIALAQGERDRGGQTPDMKYALTVVQYLKLTHTARLLSLFHCSVPASTPLFSGCFYSLRRDTTRQAAA